MNANLRHLVYLDLLYNCLTLTEEDSLRLQGRPLTVFEYPKAYPDKRLAGYKVTINPIHSNELYFQGVRSVPSEMRKLVVCSELAKKHELEGVPGFYMSANRWRLNVKGALLRPYRDERNRVIGLFVYRDFIDPTPELMTSEGLYKGTPAIQPIEHEERAVA